MLGYSAEELVDQQSASCLHLPEEIVRRAQALSDQLGYLVRPGFEVFIERVKKGGTDENEWTYVRKDGSQFPVLLTVTAVYDEAGEVEGYLGVGRDITERARVDRLKSEFIATVSHELRTPLTAISGSLRLLDSGALGALERQQERLVHIAYTNSSRLIMLVNDLLDMEKLVAGKVVFDMARVMLVPLLESVIEEMETYSADHQVDIELDTQSLDRQTDARQPVVNVDVNRFKQVVVNLLSNAVKFSFPESLVTVRPEWVSGAIRINVIDRGVGIPESFHHQIFQKFSQADSSNTRSKGGTGLGLAITKELIVRMGGDIGFKSAEGDGSCFYVTLPADLKSRFSRQAPAVLPKILQVEDDPAVQEWVAAIFMGCVSLTGVPTKAKAELLLEREDYDLIILDILLPDGNGTDLIAKVAETQAGTTDIIVLSQIPLSASQRKGCRAVVEKGAAMSDTLVAVLDEWLDEYAGRQQ